MQKSKANEFMTRGQVAKVFGVHVSNVRYWQKSGLLPSVQTPKGWWVFRRDAVIAFAEKRGIFSRLSNRMTGRIFELLTESETQEEMFRAFREFARESRSLRQTGASVPDGALHPNDEVEAWLRQREEAARLAKQAEEEDERRWREERTAKRMSKGAQKPTVRSETAPNSPADLESFHRTLAEFLDLGEAR